MRFIHEVLYSQDPELREHTEIYLDDILIHTKDKSTHKTVLERVCKCLNGFNIGIRKPSLNYLGFTITGDGYCATNEKVKAICDYPLPKTIRQLMRFCEMANFYHKSIPKSSSLLKLLYDILRDNKQKPKSTVIVWSEKQDKCFSLVKEALSEKTVLSYPIANAATFLATDASNTSIAATLHQLHSVRNKRVPLAFFSRNLQKAELKYSIFAEEILTIYCSIKHFRFMLQMRPFKILCDNQVVVKSLTKENGENFPARVLRHLQYISQYSTDCDCIASD